MNGTGPDGATVYLKDILAEGMAFWKDGKEIELTDSQTYVSGDVVVMQKCLHTGTLTYQNRWDGTHRKTCSACGYTALEDHTYDESTLVCPCGLMSESAAVTVTTKTGGTAGFLTLAEAVAAVSSTVKEDEAVVTLLTSINESVTVHSGVFTLDLKDSRLHTAEDAALTISGPGTDVTILSSTDSIFAEIRSYSTSSSAVRALDGCKLTVINSRIHGEHYGLQAKNSTVEFAGGTVGGNDGMVLEESVLTFSGDSGASCRTGAVISLISSTATISGGTILGNTEANAITTRLSTVNISGGTFTTGGAATLLLQGGETVTITGGTFNGQHDISVESGESSKLVLALAEGKTEGASFPNGISSGSTPLNTLLDEGAAYWQNGSQIGVADDQKEIADVDVVIREACPHTGEDNYTDNEYGTHTFTCSKCHYSITEPHSYDKTTLLCVCGNCGCCDHPNRRRRGLRLSDESH